MGLNKSLRYNLTFNKDSTDILNDRNSKKLAKILSKTFVHSERKLLNLDRSVVTTVTSITLIMNALNCELDFVEFNEKSEIFKIYYEKFLQNFYGTNK